MDSLNAENYFALTVGAFFFICGVIILIRGKVMSDPSERFEGKTKSGPLVRLMGALIMILGISVMCFGFIAA